MEVKTGTAKLRGEQVVRYLDWARDNDFDAVLTISNERLLSNSDPKRDPRTFRIALTRKMGTKRGKDAGSFVRETRTQAIDFYRDLVQDLRKWQPAAPKLPRDQPEEAPAIATPEPPLFSGTTSREPGTGSDPPS